MLIILSFLISCGQEFSDPMPNDPVIKFGDLQVEAFQCHNPPICDTIAPIFGANVFIYNTALRQEMGNGHARFGQTNVEGAVRFNQLDSSVVYISVIHDTFINKSIERVPQNSLTFHPVYFN